MPRPPDYTPTPTPISICGQCYLAHFPAATCPYCGWAHPNKKAVRAARLRLRVNRGLSSAIEALNKLPEPQTQSRGVVAHTPRIQMTTIKTSDLIDSALDYAVAVAEGWGEFLGNHETEFLAFTSRGGKQDYMSLCAFSPSTDPAQAWPIIELEGIATWRNGSEWRAAHPSSSDDGYYDSKVGMLDWGF